MKADADGPNWTDQRIAEAFSCRRQTVENVRGSLVTNGFEVALNGKKRETPPRKKLLAGEQEAKLIAMRLGSELDGFASWSLRLLAEKWRKVSARPQRTKVDWAFEMEELSRTKYADAEKIILISDNLNTRTRRGIL